MTARFNHPHIVTIYAVGRIEGTPYVALEYLEGQDLAARIAEQRLSEYEALRTALAVAQAIQEAHRHDVMHRDLKPANVLIPTDGRIRVVDFGLAHVLKRANDVDDDSGLPGPKSIHGTPAYMAPEQWQGEVTATTDIWAIGLMLYELIAGRPPWRGFSVLQLRARVLDPEPIEVDEALDGASPAIMDLVRDCLEKNHTNRPSAEAVVERLNSEGPGFYDTPDMKSATIDGFLDEIA